MNVLFIGGTGTISSACSQLALEKGIDLTLLNRGRSDRALPEGANVIYGDINDPNIASILDGNFWDAVVNWVAYKPDQIYRDIDLFRERTNQYIFISSASAYQTPPSHLPVSESTILDNPYWSYSRDKIACEEVLVKAYQQEKFPMTIVRPSHTYDERMIPLLGRTAALQRMLDGQEVVVFGDGTSIWTLTHNTDFAKGFVPLLGRPAAIGQAYHITSDEWLSWNQIFNIMGQALGVQPRLIHAPSELIATFNPQIGDGLLGDKMHSMIFDNSKIKRIAPDFTCTVSFAQGAQQIANWYTADPSRMAVDENMELLLQKTIAFMKQ